MDTFVPLVSHTQIGTLNECLFKFHLRYEQGWKPRTKSDALDFGSAVHSLLAAHYNHWKETGKQPTEGSHLIQHVQQQMLKTNEYGVKVIQHALSLVKRYVEDFARLEDLGWTPHKVEEHFVVPMETPLGRQYELQLYVDLLMIQKKTGNLWLWEHKTVGQGKFWKEIQIMMDNQTPTYQAALRKLGIPIYGIMFNMLNSYEYKNPAPPEKLFRRSKSYRTDVEIDNMVVELGRSVDDIIDLRENPDKPRKRNLRSRQGTCDYCYFQEPCILSMKGVDLESVLEMNYDRSSSFEKSPEFEINDD